MPVADGELLGRWIERRDPEAFRALVTRYASMVYATCRRVLGNAAEAEDVAQECFETLAFETTPPSGHLGAWLHRVATNRALDHMKSAHRRRSRERRYAAEAPEPAAITWDDVYPLVDGAIATLPEELRVPLIAAYLDGQTHRAIAKDLGIPRRTVTNRIGRAIDAVRAELVRRGVPVVGVALATMFATHAAEAAPASLVAQLGRIAISGAGSAAAPASTTTATATTVGVLMMSNKTAIGFGVGLLVFAAWLLIFHAVIKPWMDTPAPTSSATISVAPAALPHAAIPVERSLESNTVMPALDVAVADAIVKPKDDSKGTVRLLGSVMDDAGYAVEAARVRLEIARDALGFDVVRVLESNTDERGIFVIEDVTPFENGSITATAEGYVPVPCKDLSIAPGSGDRAVDFVLARGRHFISGHVVDPQRRPIAGAEVQLRYYRLKWPSRGRFYSGAAKMAAVRSDTNGYFSMAIPQRAYCDFSVVKSGYGAGYFPEIATGTDDALLLLRPGGAIAGRVTDAAGNAVAGVFVTVRGEAALIDEPDGSMPSRIAPGYTTTDASGCYEVAGLGADFTYTVTAEKTAAKAPPRNGITVKPSNTTRDIDLVLQELNDAWILGKVTDEWSGQPAQGVRVYARVLNPTPDDAGERQDSTTTTADGTYRMALALASEQRIEVRWNYRLHHSGAGNQPFHGRLPARQGDVMQTLMLEPGASTSVDFKIPAPFTAPVRFVDPEGRPVSGADVAIEYDGGEWGRMAVTGHDGRAECDGLAPGADHVVKAYINEPERVKIGESEPFAGMPAERLPEIEIVCTPRGGIEGCLLDPDGRPARDTEMGCTAVLADGTVLEPSTTYTNEDGCFVILYSLPEGTYDTVGVGFVRDGQVYRGLIEGIDIVSDRVVNLGEIVCEPVMTLEEAVEASRELDSM